MKKIVFIIGFMMVFSIVKADLEHPFDAQFATCNKRISTNNWNILGWTRNWSLRYIDYNSDGSLRWANWRCASPGTECGYGDWCDMWSMISGGTSPGTGWTQNEDGEWEPPAPDEAGDWFFRYYEQMPHNYDPETGIYY